jgi:hypothetical protein
MEPGAEDRRDHGKSIQRFAYRMLPKLGGSGWLILSGILQSQQNEPIRALQRNHLDIVCIKRRGEWTAILPYCSGALQARELARGKVLRWS